MGFDLEAYQQPGKLKRTLTLPYVVLYGLGVTVGAGIYVLVGEVISLSGHHAPISFLIAAGVMLFPAACFCELTGRFPYAAAEAHFVGVGFSSSILFLVVGLAVAAVGIISSSAIAHGAVNYIGQLTSLPRPLLLGMVIVATGAVAACGIRQSIAFAGLFTLIEVGGLMMIVLGALWSDADLTGQAIKAVPQSLSPSLWGGLAASGLLAFFAFIGFEDIDSIAEETINPQLTLTRGIFLTLAISVVIYVLVVLAALASVPLEDVTQSTAPLSHIFERVTGLPPLVITLIAIIAAVNGIIVQIIMAARVFYGLSNRGSLPPVMSRINPRTGTPIFATLFATAIVLALALLFPINRLAQSTSIITLMVFILVCAALTRIKKSHPSAPAGTFIVPRWMPYAGIIMCIGLLFFGIING